MFIDHLIIKLQKRANSVAKDFSIEDEVMSVFNLFVARLNIRLTRMQIAIYTKQSLYDLLNQEDFEICDFIYEKYNSFE